MQPNENPGPGMIPLPAGLAVLPRALSMYRDQYQSRWDELGMNIPLFALDPEGVDG